MKKTAQQFLAELSKDPEYIKLKKAQDEEFYKYEKELSQDEENIVSELRNIGFNVKSVWDFVNITTNYHHAIPILIKHFKLPHHNRILAGIARALGVEDYDEVDDVWDMLLEYYKNTIPDEEIPTPKLRGLKEGIAVALSIIVKENQINIIKELIDEVKNGESRIMLMSGLYKYRNNIDVKKYLKKIQNDNKLGLTAKMILKGKLLK